MRCIRLTMVHVHAYYRMEEDFYIKFVTFVHKFILANFSGNLFLMCGGAMEQCISLCVLLVFS